MAALSFGWWRLRDWRLGTKLTAVLLVPLMLAGVLGTLRVADLVGEANDLAAVARQVGFAQQVCLAVHDLQGERHLVTVALATDRSADRAALQAQTQRVDATVAMLRTADFRADTLAPAAAGPYRTALDRLSGFLTVRHTTLEHNAGARNVVTAYSDFIAALLDLNRGLLDGARDPLVRQADGLKALAVAKEHASQQHAVLLAAILSGVLPAEQQAVLRTTDARFDAAADEFGRAVPASQLFTTTAVIDRKRLLDAALDRAVRAAPLATAPSDWNSAAAGTVEAIRQGEIVQLNELRTATVVRSDRAWHQALWNGAAVAALLVLAVVALLVVVRSLRQPLRTAAFDGADRQLPEAVEQAVALSILNDTFRNLSGRSQDLVERQRQLINELRSREYDPELLSSLLQLDYLAVRMRRHSENLLVIAGGKLPHGGAERVAVLDVLRDAVSEVEQHQRVIMRRPPAAMVAGPVVNDLVRLIAELLDNAISAGAISAGAISAAPQESMVTLSGTLTEDGGLLVEIIDSGPGLPPEELQVINARLASPPVVDTTVSRQMGLFVVSRLAAQHGITVRLRQRRGEIGTTATVSLPCSLVSVDLMSADPASHDTQPWNHEPPEASATTEWSGTGGQLPLQVSVIDEATAVDLFSPVSIGLATSGLATSGLATSQGSSPRTAEQEWLELFDPDGSAPERDPNSDELGTAAVAGQPQEVREEIFEMVSAWFRERQSASANSYQPGDTTELPALPNGTPSRINASRINASRINARRTNAHEWRSPLDEGWQAAQALRTPVDHGVTQAGLPKRQPLAHLVSGADSVGRSGPAPVPAGPVRSPDDVRGRLSRYQHGLRVGRHARVGPDEQLTITDTLQGRFEEDQ